LAPWRSKHDPWEEMGTECLPGKAVSKHDETDIKWWKTMGKSRKNAGKTTGKCWEYAGDLLVRKPMVKPNGFFMIKPFKKRGKQTSQSHVDPLSWSHGQPVVAVQRAL